MLPNNSWVGQSLPALIRNNATTFEEFKLLLSAIRNSLDLSVDFRTLNETSVLYNHIPGGASGERFFGDAKTKGFMPSLCKAISIVAKRYSQEDSANIIKIFLLLSPGLREDLSLISALLEAATNPSKTSGIGRDERFKQIIDTHFLDESRALLSPPAEAVEPVKTHNLPSKYMHSFSLIATLFPKSDKIETKLHELFISISEQLKDQDVSDIEIAASLHNGIINIHPYVDGNGRVARVLANDILKENNMEKLDPKRDKASEFKYDSIIAKDDIQALVDLMKEPTNIKDAYSLCVAVTKEDIQAINTILERNPDAISTQVPKAKSNTPLHYACAKAKYEIAKLLISKGADAEITNDKGKTPLSLCKDAVVKIELEEAVSQRDALLASSGAEGVHSQTDSNNDSNLVIEFSSNAAEEPANDMNVGGDSDDILNPDA